MTTFRNSPARVIEGVENIPTAYRFDAAHPLPPRRVFYPGLLSEGDLAVWMGREKHRKSTLALQFAVCACLGRPFLTLPFQGDRPLKGCILDYESSNDSLYRRVKAMTGAMNLSREEIELLNQNLCVIELRRYQADGKLVPKFPVPGRNSYTPVARDFWERLINSHPADFYIIDPLRCFHGEDENNSTIAELFAEMRRIFKSAAIITPHHMTKAGVPGRKGERVRLNDDMRAWSDGCRGSGAIKAEVDAIICQEMTATNDVETIFWGAFGKDGADIFPLPLEESSPGAFYFRVKPEIPEKLEPSYRALLAAGRFTFEKAHTVKLLTEKTGISQATAYRHLDRLVELGVLVEAGGGLNLPLHTPEKLAA